jgi:hypothetical protein
MDAYSHAIPPMRAGAAAHFDRLVGTTDPTPLPTALVQAE